MATRIGTLADVCGVLPIAELGAKFDAVRLDQLECGARRGAEGVVRDRRRARPALLLGHRLEQAGKPTEHRVPSRRS